jgi:molybdate transport system permease protein
MVGGNIPGTTKTVSIAIYDRVQSFDEHTAGTMALVLLVFSFVTISLVFAFNHRRNGRGDP